MSSYKVAQDVEADDKLLGPFSFRQFIYLIIVALAGLLAWGLWTLLPPLAIIPLPLMLFFGALALPLRKDQPMETYLAAMVSFYLKPRKRLWVPDGVESLVEITVPQTEEFVLTKNLTEDEAARRLAYLADLSDSQGWSIRNVSMPSDSTSMRADIYNEAAQAEDLLDDDSTVARSFDHKIAAADSRHRQELMARMNSQIAANTPQVGAVSAVDNATASYQSLMQNTLTPSAPATAPVAPPTPAADPYQNLTPATSVQAPTPQTDPQVQFNPYPPNIRQTVIQPLSTTNQHQPVSPPDPAATTAANSTVSSETPEEPLSTSENTVSPDIINLANNSDLSVETIAREASRINQKKQQADDEVVISLR